MSRDYDSRRRSSTSGSSKMRMDSSLSQSRGHGESSSTSSASNNKRKELDNVMRKARESRESNYWNKKLIEAEERDPNRWRHSGYKELYIGGNNSGETSSSSNRNHQRNPRSPRPHSPRTRSPRSPHDRSPRERNNIKSTNNLITGTTQSSGLQSISTSRQAARSPSSDGSSCSDKSCSVCSPRERRRIVPQSRSRSKSISPVRQRIKEGIQPNSSHSRSILPRVKPRSPPPIPRPRTPPSLITPSQAMPVSSTSRHHHHHHRKEYNKPVKEKESKSRRKEKHHSRVPEDPRIPDAIPLMRRPVKIEKTYSSSQASSAAPAPVPTSTPMLMPTPTPTPATVIHPPPGDSSGSEDSDSSSNGSHIGPPRMTLSERFGKMAQWSVDRRDMENMRITKDRENAMKVVIEGEERVSRLGYDSPPPGHYPETLLAQGPRGLDCWDDVRVRYDYYKARGYLRDLTLDDYVKWEEWWYKYQEWLETERFYEQWTLTGGRPSGPAGSGGGGGRKRRVRRNNVPH